METIDKFEEYKFYYDGTQKLSERRQTTTQIYLTINTALFGAIAFLVKDAGLTGWLLVGAIAPLFLFGIVICSIWKSLLANIRTFLDWKYKQLREMETAFPETSRLITKEFEAFYTSGNRKFSFSDLEARLPTILSIIYIIYGIAMIIGAWLGWL
jgi:hypothetical protein